MQDQDDHGDRRVPKLGHVLGLLNNLEVIPLGIVESSVDDWNRYHSLHWQAALDWTLENPDTPDSKRLIEPAGQRSDLEFDGRVIGWAILVARNGLGFSIMTAGRLMLSVCHHEAGMMRRIEFILRSSAESLAVVSVKIAQNGYKHYHEDVPHLLSDRASSREL